MKKVLILLFCFSILTCLAFALKTPKKEKVRIFVSWPNSAAQPHYYWHLGDSKPRGIEPKLIERVCEVAGLEYEYVSDFEYITGDPRIDAIISGASDVSIRAISITEERSEKVAFSTPYYIDGLSALVRANSTITILEDLEGKRVFTDDFTTANSWAKNNLSNSTLISFELGSGDYIGPELMLESGAIDAYITDRSFLVYKANNNHKLKCIDGTFNEEKLGIAVNKDNKKLLKKINNALLQLKLSGELKKLTADYE